MAIEFKTIPVLHGEAAARFVEAADEALEKRGSIDFSKQVAKARAILKRSPKTMLTMPISCLENHIALLNQMHLKSSVRLLSLIRA